MVNLKKSTGYRVFQVFNFLFLALIVVFTLYPFIYLMSTSLSSNNAVMHGEVVLLPHQITFAAYNQMMNQVAFWNDYRNTIMYTVLGTVFDLALSTMCAYPLSKRIPGRTIILKLLVFTMFFSGGLIPTFILVKTLHMTNTIWSVIIPSSVYVYNVIIMRTFFEGIPSSLEEAAEIDGLNQIQVLIRIVLPLSKPILATMLLFMAVQYWNDWFQALIYINNNNLYPVTLFLRNILMGATLSSMNMTSANDSSFTLPQTLQSASVMLVTIPILCVYPFVQKYFVKGVMIGAIKE